MRILVVCGAGASSTFVAQRVRHAAHQRGLPYTAFAGTERSLPIDLDSADVVLVGPQLSPQFERIGHDAAARGVVVVLLPDDVFADRTGERTLDRVLSALGPGERTAANVGRGDSAGAENGAGTAHDDHPETAQRGSLPTAARDTP